VFAYFQECWVFFAAPIVVVFLGGILWKRGTATAALVTLLLGFPMLILVFLRRELFPGINPFNLAGMAALGMLVLYVVISFMTPRPPGKQVEENTWQREFLLLAPKNPRWRWVTSDKFWAFLLFLTYGTIYAWLW
jgi:Na+/proline symporter